MEMHQFSELPVELRSKIYKFCPRKVLINVALVSKQCREEVLPHLWETLELSWHWLETRTDVQKYEEHLIHTKRLAFDDGRSWPLRCEQGAVKEGYKSFAYHNVLRFCNPDKMRTLTFRCFLVAGGLQVASEFFLALGSLSLVRIAGVRQDWDFICSFQYLKVLKISDCEIGDDALKNIVNLKMLRDLDISNCRFLSGSCFVHLDKIASHLTHFEFTNHRNIPGYRYEQMSDFKNVKTMSLRETKVDDNFFVGLERKLKDLFYLDAGATEVTDRGLQAIYTFQSLEELVLFECDITDHGLLYLIKLKNLSSLNLACCRITDSGLAHISKMKNLESLDIGGNLSITDSGLEQIMSHPSLTSLDLCGCHTLTDIALDMISKKMLRLEYIDVTCKKFTIDGLNHLLALPHLSQVMYDTDEINKEDIEQFFNRLNCAVKDRDDKV